MRRILLGALAASIVGAVGCASSSEIYDNGQAHLQKSQYYEARGDYYTASKERAAADKQFNKAQQRAYDEAYYRPYWF